MSKNLLFALCFVLTVASCAVWAEKPPKELMAVVASAPIVHDDKCDFQGVKGIECLIMYDASRDIIWLVLFDQDLAVYMVAAVHKKKESIMWCRSNVCV